MRKWFYWGMRMQSKQQEQKKKGAIRDKNLRLLKSIHAHYSASKGQNALKALEGVIQGGKGADLREAMEDAKTAYESMRDVQEQLNRAYRDLMQAEKKMK